MNKQINLAHSRYVNEVIGGSLEEGDGKAFWNYIKLNRTDSIGVPLLKVENKAVEKQQNLTGQISPRILKNFANNCAKML